MANPNVSICEKRAKPAIPAETFFSLALLNANLWTLFLLTLAAGKCDSVLLLLSFWQSIVASVIQFHSSRGGIGGAVLWTAFLRTQSYC